MGSCSSSNDDDAVHWSRLRARLAVHGTVDKAVAREVFVHPGGRVNVVVCQHLILAPANERAAPQLNVALVFERATLMQGTVKHLHVGMRTQVEASAATVPALHFHSETGLMRTGQLFLRRSTCVEVESITSTLDLTTIDWNKVPRRVEVVGTLDKAIAREIHVSEAGKVGLAVCQILVMESHVEGEPTVETAFVWDKLSVAQGAVKVVHMSGNTELVTTSFATVEKQVYLTEPELLLEALSALEERSPEDTGSGEGGSPSTFHGRRSISPDAVSRLGQGPLFTRCPNDPTQQPGCGARSPRGSRSPWRRPMRRGSCMGHEEGETSDGPAERRPSQPVSIGVEDGSEENDSCCICMDGPKNVVFLPCRHLCCCRECGPLCKLCPICRLEITDTFNIFVA